MSASDAPMELWGLLINAFMGKGASCWQMPQVQNLAPKLLCPWANYLTSLILNFLTCQVVMLTTLSIRWLGVCQCMGDREEIV